MIVELANLGLDIPEVLELRVISVDSSTALYLQGAGVLLGTIRVDLAKV